MARWTTPADTADHPGGSTPVRMERLPFPSELLADMTGWLSSRDRPGLFSIRDARRELVFWEEKKKQVVVFHITDPEVAFEFKMRWA